LPKYQWGKKGPFCAGDISDAVNAVMAVQSFQAAVVDPNIKFSTWLFVNSGNPNTAQNATITAATHMRLRTLTIYWIFSHTGYFAQMTLSPVTFTRTAHATVSSNQIIKRVKEK
jgi:hypothetical protein